MSTVILRRIKPVANGDCISHVVDWMERCKCIQLPRVKQKPVKPQIVKHAASGLQIGNNAMILRAQGMKWKDIAKRLDVGVYRVIDGYRRIFVGPMKFPGILSK